MSNVLGQNANTQLCNISYFSVLVTELIKNMYNVLKCENKIILFYVMTNISVLV